MFKKAKGFFGKGKHTTNEDAAAIIRRFVYGTSDQYEWDDFETQNEMNPEVDLAIHLCWYFAGEFPAKKPTEYCGRGADKHFLRIAEALEKGSFAKLDHEAIKKSLQNNIIPETIRSTLGINT